MGPEQKITAAQRRQMIAEAAYFRAERRGFDAGDPLRDWCDAEAEVDARLRQLEGERLLGRAEESLAAAKKRLAAVKRKMAGLSAEARAEWQKDLDKLAKLRDSLQPRLAELREQGEHAGQRLRQQVEKLGEELTDLVQRLSQKRRQ